METLEVYENNLGYKIIQRYLPSWDTSNSCQYLKTLVVASLIMITVWSLAGIAIFSTALLSYLLITVGQEAGLVFVEAIVVSLTQWEGAEGILAAVIAFAMLCSGTIGVGIFGVIVFVAGGGVLLVGFFCCVVYFQKATAHYALPVFKGATDKLTSSTTFKLIRGWTGKYCVPVKIVKQGSKKND